MPTDARSHKVEPRQMNCSPCPSPTQRFSAPIQPLCTSHHPQGSSFRGVPPISGLRDGSRPFGVYTTLIAVTRIKLSSLKFVFTILVHCLPFQREMCHLSEYLFSCLQNVDNGPHQSETLNAISTRTVVTIIILIIMKYLSAHHVENIALSTVNV